MIQIGELIRSGLKKAPAFAVVSALVGAVLAAALPLLMLPGITEAFGIAPILGFGLMGALGGASTAAMLATGLGAAESFDQQREAAGSQQSRGNTEVSADPYIAPSSSLPQTSQERLNPSNNRGGWNRV